MTYALMWLRSLLYQIQVYFMMVVIGVIWLPWALFDRRGAFSASKTWCRWALWTLRGMCGVRTEVRGPVPEGEVLIGAKHQSFLDVILIFMSVPAGKFIMKRELIYVPVIGQYALRMGCVPVARGKKAQAVKQMVKDVKTGRSEPGQLIIYPQGTRISPGDYAGYKPGALALYKLTGQPCVPVAGNVGLFWPRKGIIRKPGLAVVEFLDPIPAGLPSYAFMERLETVIETRSNALMEEAGFATDHIAGKT